MTWGLDAVADRFLSPNANGYAPAMPRGARIVVPGLPHHVTQRGNRRDPIFFEDGDQHRYLSFLTAQCRRHDVELWAYCLMPNHVHLILTRKRPKASAGRWVKPIGDTRRS